MSMTQHLQHLQEDYRPIASISHFRNGSKYWRKIENLCCDFCGKKDGRNIWKGPKESLEVHHIDTNRRNNEPNNIHILCGRCHRMLHKYYKYGKDAMDKPLEWKKRRQGRTFDCALGSCKNKFEAKKNWQKYCSVNCRRVAWHMKKAKEFMKANQALTQEA